MVPEIKVSADSTQTFRTVGRFLDLAAKPKVESTEVDLTQLDANSFIQAFDQSTTNNAPDNSMNNSEG